jgi:hypothetical protein
MYMTMMAAAGMLRPNNHAFELSVTLERCVARA